MARGLAATGESVRARRLSGGVSNVVLDVRVGGQRLVVKQSLAQLAVAQQWLAPRRRTATEAAALRLVTRWTPDQVPAVVDIDPDALVLVLTHAPDAWRVVKADLFAGWVDAALFTELGRVLGCWHEQTRGRPHLTADCDDPDAFRQLRTDPFHRAAADAHPALAREILGCVVELEQARVCLVHGDFSPKNILSGKGGFWVLDFEVAHVGNPIFDLAFLLSHLLLKASARPRHGEVYGRAAQHFVDGYRSTVGAALQPDATSLSRHVGCLLLARVDGKSPAGYLTVDQEGAVRSLGATLLTRPVGSVAAMMSLAR